MTLLDHKRFTYIVYIFRPRRILNFMQSDVSGPREYRILARPQLVIQYCNRRRLLLQVGTTARSSSYVYARRNCLHKRPEKRKRKKKKKPPKHPTMNLIQTRVYVCLRTNKHSEIKFCNIFSFFFFFFLFSFSARLFQRTSKTIRTCIIFTYAYVRQPNLNKYYIIV